MADKTKHVHVAAALIMRQGDDGHCRLFCAQRGYGAWKGWWEFPGGKIEPGESAMDALIRELSEELGVTVVAPRHVATVRYDYPEFRLTMECFACALSDGERIALREHEDARWLTAAELRTVKWLPADEQMLELVTRLLTARSDTPGQSRP